MDNNGIRHITCEERDKMFLVTWGYYDYPTNQRRVQAKDIEDAITEMKSSRWYRRNSKEKGFKIKSVKSDY